LIEDTTAKSSAAVKTPPMIIIFIFSSLAVTLGRDAWVGAAAIALGLRLLHVCARYGVNGRPEKAVSQRCDEV
jgi:hypothetical protein